jgi:hypoxanthine phosphoribosyltransferase
LPEISNKTDQILVNNDVFVPFLKEAEIKKRIDEIASQINNDYKGTVPVFIGVLNGAFVFMSDLIKRITLDCEIDFFKLSSYGDEKISSGQVKLLKELNCNVNGRDIIIVEDIVDTGLSIKFIEELFEKHNPASMKVCTLLVKPDSLRYKPKIDYIGFNIPSKFVVGYGLGYAQKYRNLKDIYIISE